jgi:para-nitrobenzyl esterase
MMRRRRAGLAGFAVLLLAAASASAAPAPPVVRAPSGALAGVDQGKTHAFLGIPYAEAPVGPLRWKAPRPLPAWRGVRQATRFGHSCWQAVSPQGFGPWTHEYVVQRDISEDCLFLNVWAPAHARGKLPVLMWIHGGGFNSGSGAIPIYDGRALAGRGIVVVTINYRVGLFGFLAHPDLTREAAGGPNANFGLQDMIAALKWVRANIGAFHGDPRAITIAGQSAGSMAVHELLASPLAKGLFARAISESGLLDPGEAPPLAQAEAAGLAFANEKGAASIAELRAMPAEVLVASKGGNQVRFVPILDGVLLRGVQPISRVPTLVGFTADEGSALGRDYGSPDPPVLQHLLASHYGASAARFAPFYPAATAGERAESNRQLRRDLGAGSIYAWAERRGAGPPIYAYRWTHIEPGPQADHWLAFHSSEIPYVFQTLDASPERGFTAADRLLSRRISTYWLNFIRSGDPNGGGLPAWPRLDLGDPRILEIGDRIESRPLLPADRMKAMRDFVAAGGNPSIF